MPCAESSSCQTLPRAPVTQTASELQIHGTGLTSLLRQHEDSDHNSQICHDSQIQHRTIRANKQGPGANPDKGQPLSHAFALDPFGVADGTRTRDILDHNQVLYQLNYSHHCRLARGVATMRKSSSWCSGHEIRTGPAPRGIDHAR